MRQRMVVTDVAAMESRVCIAGYGSDDQRSIRPVPSGGGGIPWFSLLDERDQVVEPFSEVEVSLRGSRPDPPHTEDHVFQGTPKFRLVRNLSESEAIHLLEGSRSESVADIFGAEVEDRRLVRPGSGSASLGTIRIEQIDGVNLRRDERYQRDHFNLAFRDQGGTQYNLRATDVAFRVYCRRVSDGQDGRRDLAAIQVRERLNDAEFIYLRIGLSRPHQSHADTEPACFLMVTGVYTFPSYLDGRWADYYVIPGRE